MLEVCCGSYYDALQAEAGGAKRIELNCGLHLGGLTPSIASLELVKEHCRLQVIAMVRPRGGGFCYSTEDFQVMKKECDQLLRHGADGIAFGCLREDGSLHVEQNQQILEQILNQGKEAVFHRAFDCSKDPYKTIEQLIQMKVTRLLTSGLKPKAMEGMELLKTLQKAYGAQIQLLAGSGIQASNAKLLMEATGITQVHSSCKVWHQDPTTISNEVSYSFAPSPNQQCYDVVSKELVEEILHAIGQ